MHPGTRKPVWPTVLAALALSALVLCAGSLLLLQKALPELLIGETDWSVGAVPASALPRLFGVRLSATPTFWRSRSYGFQDHSTEVFFELSAAEVETFLSGNGLSREPIGTAALGATTRELSRLLESKGAITTTPLQGLKDELSADGGYVVLYRSGALLEVDGRTFIYLQAFDT